MLEARRISRTRVSKAAKVITSHPWGVYECLVRDISSLGARLEYPSTAVFPDIFELTFNFSPNLASLSRGLANDDLSRDRVFNPSDGLTAGHLLSAYGAC